MFRLCSKIQCGMRFSGETTGYKISEGAPNRRVPLHTTVVLIYNSFGMSRHDQGEFTSSTSFCFSLNRCAQPR